MSKIEQGVLQINEGVNSLIHLLLLAVFCLVNTAIAESLPADTPSHKIDAEKHHVFVIHTPGSALHTGIIQKVSEYLNLKRSDIIISNITPDEKINNASDIIIAIGRENIQIADKHYPKSNKLFISTAPNKYRLNKNKNKHKTDAILYITQSYCRKIRFIKLLNSHWKTISILNGQKNPVDSDFLQQCANKYGIKIVTVNTTVEDNLTNKINNALRHSDVLLALPDSNIYNSKTVKNILLTSYRHRKPVIAFSKNFVNAGALASIHSNTEQVALSASKLIEQYFESDLQFVNTINYPDTFDVNVNRQVFKALDLPIPDMDRLKQSLQQPVQNRHVDSL